MAERERFTLPERFAAWFAQKGWQPHAHQLALLEIRQSSLLVAPTGGGKTLAGFLPALVDLAAHPHTGLHTLYVSPLKALAADVARNLETPIREMALPISLGARTGDTSAGDRRKFRAKPPQILLTTPESLALMLSWPEAAQIFAGLKYLILDEIHALIENKRGTQLLLGAQRLAQFAPHMRRIGLSATVDAPEALAEWIGAKEVVRADPGPAPDIALLPTRRPPPWAGQGARYSVPDVLAAVSAAKTTIIFHNSRAQAELFFQSLWLANHENLPIALHHSALSREARAKVEAAMAAGTLRAVVATGTLDLGLDWGDVDLVLQIGAPRNIKRLVQRIGRAGHKYNTPSVARLVPANRFEVIECVAALEAALHGHLDKTPPPAGALEVLIQHILLTACAGPFEAEALYEEVRGAGPYRSLTRAEFDACLDCAATGGYALRAYDLWQRLLLRDGRWQLRDPRAARVLRMNVGTIQDGEKLKVKRKGRTGASLGLIEESFATTLSKGDTFLLGGQVLRFEKLQDMQVEVTPAPGQEPKIVGFSGQGFASSLELSQAVLAQMSSPARRGLLPAETQSWLALQADVSALPDENTLLCEVFPQADRWHLVIYGFAGKNAHQTLGLLLSHRMEQLALAPLAFVAQDHALLLTSLRPVEDVAGLLEISKLDAGLQYWMAQSSLLKRSFRAVASIAGLITRQQPGGRKTGKQATFSSDILYDTLRRYDPEHILLRATEEEAQRGLIDFGRIEEMLAQFGQIKPMRLERVSPLAAPLLMQIGRVRLSGAGQDELAARLAQDLLTQSGLDLLDGL